MTQIALHSVDVGGIPYTEFRHEPEHSTSVQLCNTYYITAVASPGLSTHRYLITLMHRVSGQEQLVDLVLSDDGFLPMIATLRLHFSPHNWEIFSWLQPDAPF